MEMGAVTSQGGPVLVVASVEGHSGLSHRAP